MTLRTRFAVLASLAVALAVVAGAASAWFIVRSTLLDDVDARLMERVASPEVLAGAADAADSGESEREVVVLVDDPIGVQLLDAEGEVTREAVMDSPGGVLDDLPVSAEALAPGESRLETVAVDGRNYRALAAALPDGGTIRLVQPLASVESALSRTGVLLGFTAAGGVAFAALLGGLVARSALRPISRLVSATESVRQTHNLQARIEVGRNRRDEISRLASSMNEMLAALSLARRRQRELVENAAHELRTPLAVLRNDLGLLLRAEDDRRLDSEDRAEVIRELDDQVTALGSLSAELVELARGDLEQEEFESGDVLETVRRAVAASRRVDPSVEVRVEGDAIRGELQRAALERAIGNLVRNAIQSSPPGGAVEVDVRRRSGSARIRVADRGHGLREDEIPHLFERFFRGVDARTRLGSGLGLAIVRQAAESLGGSIEAENRRGGGAVFTLEFPVRASDPD